MKTRFLPFSILLATSWLYSYCYLRSWSFHHVSSDTSSELCLHSQFHLNVNNGSASPIILLSVFAVLLELHSI